MLWKIRKKKVLFGKGSERNTLKIAKYKSNPNILKNKGNNAE